MTKKFKKMQSRVGDERMLDSEEEHKIVLDLDIDDGEGAPRTEHDSEEAARQLQKAKKQNHKKGKDDTLNNNPGPAEDSDGKSERPRKRHKLPGPGRSHMQSRSANTDPSRSSPIPSEPLPPASVVSGFPELQSDTQSLLDHRTRIRTPTAPPPPLQRFPLPSRPHAPEKSVLASQGLDRALARAQLVDPLLSTPLSFDKNGDDVTGLSTKALRRLRDLGIVELFAGVLLYHGRFRKRTKPVLSLVFVPLSPDYAVAFAPPSRTSEAVIVPPI
jgi:hypothetical protein